MNQGFVDFTKVYEDVSSSVTASLVVEFECPFQFIFCRASRGEVCGQNKLLTDGNLITNTTFPPYPETDVPVTVLVKHFEHLINELVSIPLRHGVDVSNTLSVDLPARTDIDEATEPLFDLLL